MPKKKQRITSMTESLKKAIRDSGLSFRFLGHESGVKRQSLMKFMSGETSLRLDMADKLAKYFELELK
jgi:plasmid maintenance system antidote protein VapI